MSDGERVLVTGNSSGLGRGLSEAWLERGAEVYGLSRRGSPDLAGRVADQTCDLADLEAIPGCLQRLLGDAPGLDVAVLNAGVLGRIEDVSATPLEEMRAVMDLNLWANKVVMDWLHAWGRPLGQVVMVSSGAAVLGNRGWGAYALSKAALNMLARLYAHEFPGTHITALAPGIIDTPMMDYLCGEADAQAFPALQRLRDARGTAAMPGPREAAEQVISVLGRLREEPSGSFVDIRSLLDPEAYRRLMAGRQGPGAG